MTILICMCVTMIVAGKQDRFQMTILLTDALELENFSFPFPDSQNVDAFKENPGSEG